MSRAPRKFSDLRGRETAPSHDPDEDTIERVIARLARTHDGLLLAAWLRDEAQRPLHVGATDAQLREAEGARRLADRILEMATTTVR
ncbi:hypothetical protein V8J38_11170 [Brevundimonas olei]|uniref:Uncharacterized protein n=1 Tax=Brevundimonas olei TaxID=657642 RepID=A0ABZ2IBX8_9CAUL